MKQKQIIQMDFSGVLRRQKLFWEAPVQRVDLTGVRGTNGYCSEEAAEAIRAAISAMPAEGVHFLDSGNYHYASLFWMEKIREPYDLVVFDHHTDMQPSAWGEDLISCGSWIRYALLHTEDVWKQLRNVWVAGPEPAAVAEARSQPGTDEFMERVRFCAPEMLAAVLKKEGARPVYLSVDKDVLAVTELETNWDQGTLLLSQIMEYIADICGARHMIGADICGEPDPQASDLRVEESEAVNRKLLAQLLV